MGRQDGHPDLAVVGVAGGGVGQLVGESGLQAGQGRGGPDLLHGGDVGATWSMTAAREASLTWNAASVVGPPSWPGRNRFSRFQFSTRTRLIEAPIRLGRTQRFRYLAGSSLS